MKITLFSDLHLEFAPWAIPDLDVDVVVLAGDIAVGTHGIEWALEQETRAEIIYICGNHEFYGHCHPGLMDDLRASCRSSERVHFLENESIVVAGVAFHAATLWMDFQIFGPDPTVELRCERALNDFRMIRNSQTRRPISTNYIKSVFIESRDWLAQSLDASTASKNVVITHHAPSLRSIPEIYKSDPVTGAFASNLEDFIARHKPTAWLHGHCHTSAQYNIEGCDVFCNPRGYPREVTGWDPRLVIDI